MKNRVLVIGLDGATLDLILPWMKSGYLPNLSKLAQNGSFGNLESVLPVISSSAWASFMTGVNPGKHGMVDFVIRDKLSYDLAAVNRYDIHRNSLWKTLSDQGKKSIIVNVPITYPPEEINGIIVSGLGTPSNKNFTYPIEYSKNLNSLGYKVNKDHYFSPGEEDLLIKDIYDHTINLTKISLNLIEQEWDLFVVIYRDTDEIGHFFWKDMDEKHPLHDESRSKKYKNIILDYYIFIDKQICELLEKIDNKTTVIIMSDHGQGPLYKDVYLNHWLEKKGYLVFNEKKQSSINTLFSKIGLTRDNISMFLRKRNLSKLETILKDILKSKIDILPKNERLSLKETINWEKTKAYSFGYTGQIYLNLEGREPKGIISPDDYDQVVKQLKQDLKKMVDPEDNKKIVDKIYLKEECYHGENIEKMPDLIVIMRDFSYITRLGFEIPENFGFFSPPTNFESASHRLNGILFLAGSNIKPNLRITQANIMDCFPTILYLLDCEIPIDLDGNILRDYLLNEKKEIYSENNTINKNESMNELSKEENDELLERLRNLGYLK